MSKTNSSDNFNNNNNPLNSSGNSLNNSGSNINNCTSTSIYGHNYEDNNVKVLDDEEISGFLFKKGAKGIVQSWRKRWFVVRKSSRVIEYYRSPNSNSEPLGYIDIGNILQITSNDTNNNTKKDKKEFQFQISTQNRIYYLYATEEQIMNYWIRELTQVCFLIFLKIISLTFLLFY